METFGRIIEAARTRHALSQGDLAIRLGVKQQTVSRWEKGQSRPQGALLGKLAAVLEVPVADLKRATDAGKEPPLPQADRPLADVLPMSVLAADRFEQFVADLLERRFPGAMVSRLGAQGDDQRGFDILVVHPDGRRVGVQCKRERQFGPKKITRAISVAELDVDQSVIALSRRATSAARFEIDMHPRWAMWDQDDMSRWVRQLPRESALSLVDSFFPGSREPFLGIRAPASWLTVEEFFPASPTTLLHHRQKLAGRQAMVSEIADWICAVDGSAVGVLVGRGGIGKSKLLFEIAIRTYDPPVNFRFLATGHTPKLESFDELPSDGRLLVVIDDAHNVDAIAGIATQLRLHRPAAKLLLAARPYGVTLLDAEIWKLNQSPRLSPRWTLDDLSREESAGLVSELIGRPVHDAMTLQLAGISADCPFVALAAADLLKRGALSSRTFSSSTDLRAEVMQRFTELAIPYGSTLMGSELRAVLTALSAFQPVRLNDPVFQQAMTMLTSIASWDLVSGRVRELENIGLVLRRGEAVRVVPDMLGDIVLSRAAFDDRSKVGTTYLERAQAAATGTALQHLLVNASRMDWQTRDGNPARANTVGRLWAALHKELLTAEPDEQVPLLNVVAKVAFYQPERALALVNDVLELDADAKGPSSADDPWHFNRDDVTKAIPAVLRNIAYNFAYLEECLERLWLMAQGDKRPTNQFPDHPLRVLSELADLRTGKPLAYGLAVIDMAERWLDRQAGGSPSPFDVLDPILDTEITDQIWSGLTLTIRSSVIRPDSVRDIRSRVIDLAARYAESGDPVVATRAVRTLTHSIRGPASTSDREPTKEEKAQWAAEFLPVISLLGVIGTNPQHDPAVRLAIRQALDWHAEHSTTETRDAAQEALSKLVTSTEDDLALCLHYGWGALDLRDGCSYAEAERSMAIEFNRVAATITRKKSDEDVVELLDRRIAIDRAAFNDTGSPGRFLWSLFRVRPSVAACVCEEALSGHFGQLHKFVSEAIAALADVGDPRAVVLASKLIVSKSVELQRAAAWGLSWNRGLRKQLLNSELELLGQMARHPDEHVRGAIGRAVHLMGLSDKAIALDLLSQIEFGGSGKVASETLGSLIPPGPLSWSDIELERRKSIITQLVECDSVGSYEVMTAIGELSRIEPVRVTRLLIARVNRESTMSEGYTALPDRWNPALKIRETPQLARCLTEVRDWMIQASRDEPYYMHDPAAELYSLVAGPWDTQASAVLTDFGPADPRAAVLVVARILGQAPAHVLYDNVDLVAKTLRRAQELGSETARLVPRTLAASINFAVRGFWGSAPPAEDVEQRDRAAQIAMQLPRGSIEAGFYQALARDAEGRISWITGQTDESFDGRDW